MKHYARLCAALSLSLSLVVALRAQTITTWTGSTSSDFFTASNWTNGIPNFDGVAPFSINGIIANGNTVTVTTANTFSLPVDLATVRGGSTLDVQSSGTLYLIGLVIGDSGSAGSANVTGQLTGFFGFNVGSGGNGALTVQSGGKLAGGVNLGGTGTTSSLTLTGANSQLRYDSEADVNSSIQGGNGNVSVTITAGASADGPISLGGNGTSTLLISNGGTHTGGGLFLSATTGGSVAGHITDANTTVTSDDFSVGGAGTSTLLIDGGATVNSGNYVSEVGTQSEHTGVLTLSDAGTTWSSAGGQILLGANGGSGTFNISSGAAASLADVTIGRDTGSSGTVNVNGGSLTVTNSLRLGDNTGAGGGTGTMAISGGGNVTSAYGLVGNGAGGTGTVTISGAGSSWSAGSTFEVASSGTGSVTVTNGGALSNSSIATVGGNSGATGSVTVTGPGSTWTSAGTVTVSAAGSGSTGAITLANGGQFTITSGHLRLSEGTGAGALNIGADALSAAAAPGTLVLGSGTVRSLGTNGTVVFNHTSSSYVFDDSLEFGVKVLQKAGTTTLSGPVTGFAYSGGTTISGGTLKLGADNALGTGGLTLSGGTLDLNDFSQTAGALNVTGNTFIDFTATSQLLLSDSSALSWSGILTVLNFDGGDTFRVGTTSGGLTGTQLNLIHIGGFYAQIDAAGYLSASSTAIPEPAAYAAIAGLTALGLAARRRRLLPVGPDR